MDSAHHRAPREMKQCTITLNTVTTLEIPRYPCHLFIFKTHFTSASLTNSTAKGTACWYNFQSTPCTPAMPCSLLPHHHLPLSTHCKPPVPLSGCPLPWGSAAVPRVPRDALLWAGTSQDPRAQQTPLPALKHSAAHETSSKETEMLLAQAAAVCMVRLKTPFMNLQLVTPQAVYRTPNMFSHTKCEKHHPLVLKFNSNKN